MFCCATITVSQLLTSENQDPREYLPFLQKLQSTPELRRRFSIDDGLGRYAKALRHLYELDVFDEFKAYIVRHHLHDEALKIVRYQSEQLEEVMKLYADHLSRSSNFKDAAIGMC